MLTKMFKGMGGCPFTKNTIDSPGCRQCQYFFRVGTETFIWCKHEPLPPEPKKPIPERRKPIIAESVQETPAPKAKTKTGKKAGRPKKDKNKPTTTEKRHKRATNAKQA